MVPPDWDETTASHPVDVTSYQELSWLMGLRVVDGGREACGEAERATGRQFADGKSPDTAVS